MAPQMQASAIRQARMTARTGGADAEQLVSRVNNACESAHTDDVFSALVDAFIGLPSDNQGQRATLLKRARPFLNERQGRFLSEHQPAGLPATTPTPDAPTSVLSGGLIGTTQLVMVARPASTAEPARNDELALRPDPAPTATRQSRHRVPAIAGALGVAALMIVAAVVILNRDDIPEQAQLPTPATSQSSPSEPANPARDTPPGEQRLDDFLAAWTALLADPEPERTPDLLEPGSVEFASLREFLSALQADQQQFVLEGLRVDEPSATLTGPDTTITADIQWDQAIRRGDDGIIVEVIEGPAIPLIIEIVVPDGNGPALSARITAKAD